MRFSTIHRWFLTLSLPGICSPLPQPAEDKTDPAPPGYLDTPDKNGFYRFPDTPVYNIPSDKRYKRVGDGNPHQKFLHKQITDILSCGSLPTCSISQAVGEVSTIGFTASLTYEFLTAGFHVDESVTNESVTTSTTKQCGGQNASTVCIWRKVAMTQYTIQPYKKTGVFKKKLKPNGPPVYNTLI